MNKYSEWLDSTRAIFANGLNQHLMDEGLDAIEHFLASSITLEDNPKSLAIYPTSSGEPTYEETGSGDIICRFTVAFYLNDEANEESIRLTESYFEALTGFISNQIFGEESTIDRADIVRMDDMEPVNGAVFLIRSRISSLSDYGWI